MLLRVIQMGIRVEEVAILVPVKEECGDQVVLGRVVCGLCCWHGGFAGVGVAGDEGLNFQVVNVPQSDPTSPYEQFGRAF
jgi:hypothetical protein